MTNKSRNSSYRESEIRRMQAAFENGGISRRDFMQGLMAAGLTVSGATAILGSARDVKAMTPKKGGRLRYAWNLHGPDDTLDPALLSGGLDYVRARSYYNNLVQFNDDLTLRPDLAEEWGVSPDGLEWTFKLRKDVEFHDGAPFTADDVIYTLNRHMGEDSISKVTQMVSFVSEWKKVDKHTVKAMLASPNSDLPAVLGTFHFKIIQNGAEGEYFNKPNGTGPFKPVEFTPGVRSLGVRNDNYFKGEVYLDEIETFGITDHVARVNALVSGDVEIIGSVDPKAIKQIEASERAEMWSVPSGTYNGIVLSLDREPGNNPDFVWALKYLVNRERVVRTILKGQGLVGNDHPIGPPYGADHCSELAQHEFDPDRAKFHLEKSGIKETTVEVADVLPGITDTCLLLQRDAEKIGLKFNVKRVPTDGYWGNIWMVRPVFVTSWFMRPTANMMFSIAYASDAPWNESRWKNERFDQLLAETRVVQDTGLRHEMYCEMQRLVSDSAGVVIPNHLHNIDAKLKKVKGVTNVPLMSVGGGEWPDSVWLDT
jgi:peptide/nickel transport system substrate-binding protein